MQSAYQSRVVERQRHQSSPRVVLPAEYHAHALISLAHALIGGRRVRSTSSSASVVAIVELDGDAVLYCLVINLRSSVV